MDVNTPPATRKRPEPLYRIEAGAWLRESFSREDLFAELGKLLDRNEERLGAVRRFLSTPMASDELDRLMAMITWGDAQIHFVGSCRADADALLDVAEKHFMVPSGTTVPCTTRDGEIIPASTRRRKATTPAEEPEAIDPKWQTLTDNDRKVETAARCAPFRRIRDEFVVMAEALNSRIILGRLALREFGQRHRADGGPP